MVDESKKMCESGYIVMVKSLDGGFVEIVNLIP
jgi:hypothetical protein